MTVRTILGYPFAVLGLLFMAIALALLAVEGRVVNGEWDAP